MLKAIALYVLKTLLLNRWRWRCGQRFPWNNVQSASISGPNIFWLQFCPSFFATIFYHMNEMLKKVWARIFIQYWWSPINGETHLQLQYELYFLHFVFLNVTMIKGTLIFMTSCCRKNVILQKSKKGQLHNIFLLI